MAVYPLARGKVRTQRQCFRATICAHSAGLHHQLAVRARSVVLLLWYEPLAAALIVVPVAAVAATELQCTLGFDFALL